MQGVKLPISFIIHRSSLQRRFDAPAHKKAFYFNSNTYPTVRLSDIAFINPTTSFLRLNPNEVITFVPMEAVDDEFGVINMPFSKKVKDCKGFTRFKENDLIWAKITPCMQNGKSAVVRDTINGFACGSTEFYIIRPKTDEVKVDYLHYLLRDERILSSAQNYFGGTAGQQRVAKEFLINFPVPLLPPSAQELISKSITDAYLLKKGHRSKVDLLRNSIDVFLLNGLDIRINQRLPDAKSKYFITAYSDITGGRFDPKLYEQSTKDLKAAIKASPFAKEPLKNLITHRMAGDWGMEDTEEVIEGYQRCLVIRATEFDNEANLDLNNSRVKHRLISKYKLKRMDIKANDLLIEKSGGSPDQPVGRIALITEEMLTQHNLCYSNFIHKIRVDESKVLPEYLFYFLKAMHNIKLTEAMQSQTNGIRNLIMSNYFNQDIMLPDPSIQNEIVTKIRGIRSEIDKLNREAEEVLSNAKRTIEQLILG